MEGNVKELLDHLAAQPMYRARIRELPTKWDNLIVFAYARGLCEILVPRRHMVPREAYDSLEPDIAVAAYERKNPKLVELGRVPRPLHVGEVLRFSRESGYFLWSEVYLTLKPEGELAQRTGVEQPIENLTIPISCARAAKEWFQMDSRTLKKQMDAGGIRFKRVSERKYCFDLDYILRMRSKAYALADPDQQ